jgi:hypothetical protein
MSRASKAYQKGSFWVMPAAFDLKKLVGWASFSSHDVSS